MARGGRARRPPADARRRLALDHLACRASCAPTSASPPPRSPVPRPSCRATAGASRVLTDGPRAARVGRRRRLRGPRLDVRAAPRPARCRDFEVVDGEAALEIVTDRLRLVYDRGPFTPAGLSVQVARQRQQLPQRLALRRAGARPRRHRAHARRRRRPGRRSSPASCRAAGVAALDDSRSFLFEDDGWVSPRDGGAHRPLRLRLRPRLRRRRCEAFYAVSGPPPVLPRWALGNWWSRYHRYSADSYLALLDRFEEEGLPFSVAVLDMDWHRVDVGARAVRHRAGPATAGSRELFPDPEGFLAELHRRGLRVTLNVHPADGVRAFEDAYPAMAEALGRDPAADEPIAFDITDRGVPRRPTSRSCTTRSRTQGVDFWWLDWQQGPHSRIAGHRPAVDAQPLPLPRLRPRRPAAADVLALRRAGQPPLPGRLLRRHASSRGRRCDFQPEFTATASNIGYGWWSHDIGGHIFGVRDDELATRWVQLGVFSPILRLHSSSNPFLVKEPWLFPREARAAMGDALRFRHRLVPYLHTMNHRAAAEGVPLVRPMYHLAPDGAARLRRAEPVRVRLRAARRADHHAARPGDAARRRCARGCRPGTWIDIFTATVYDGDREIELHRDGRLDPRAAARRRHPAAGGRGRPRRHRATRSGSRCSSRPARTARSR